MQHKLLIIVALLCLLPSAAMGQAFGAVPASATTTSVGARLKDIAVVQGVRPNDLIGYGVVTGLNGTGDSTVVSRQLLGNLLERLHLTAGATALNAKNIAAVMVSASLPSFAKEGSAIDVTVSSYGDAKSLAGGILLFTPLKGADGEVYAIAQGPVSVGGYSFSGAGGQAQKNHPLVGRIPDGATIERETQTRVLHDGLIALTLRHPDFTSAQRLADAINKAHQGSAKAVDSASVQVEVPEEFQSKDTIVQFISRIEDILVVPDAVAKVIINERTGTIVAGSFVRIHRVAVSHGNLTLSISESAKVSQPNPFSDGQTVVTPETTIDANEEESQLYVLEEGVSVETIAQALNALGATSRDMICIFQALKAAGALHAQLVIM